jgi:flagellar FliJ protein
MKRFAFKLQKLLELREFKERQAELDLARITGTCVLLDNRLKAIAASKARVYKGRFTSGRTLSDLFADEFYLVRLDSEKNRTLEERAKAELARLESQKKYLEASRDKKVLDKLREKRVHEYRKAAELEGVKIIDDIANNMRRARTEYAALYEER